MREIFGEEWEAAEKELKKYWMHRCDEDTLIINLKILRNERMASILLGDSPITVSGAVHRANRMMGWWWEE